LVRSNGNSRSGAHISHKNHPPSGNQVKKGLDFTVLFKYATNLLTGRFILVTPLALVQTQSKVLEKRKAMLEIFNYETCLNVADEQGATWSFTLDSLFDN